MANHENSNTDNKLTMEIVYLKEIDKRRLHITEKARYESLVRNKYRWNWKIKGGLLVSEQNFNSNISVEKLIVQFSENACDRYTLLLPEGEFARYRTDSFLIFQQKQPENNGSGTVRIDFIQHLHTFKIICDGKACDPDQQFWQHMRNFFGYNRVLDPNYEDMNIELYLCIKADDRYVHDLKWISNWNAVRDLQSVEESDQGIIKQIYTTQSQATSRVM